MKRIITLLLAMTFLCWNAPFMSTAISKDMDHGDMKSGNMEMTEHDSSETFSHEAIIDGVKAEFQIMNLESMKMKDPEGKTHHIMVKFFNEESGEQLKNVAGKIKIIGPASQEQEGTLKDYSGIYAANFTFDQMGKYGVICLFKTGGKKRVVKFWYSHS